MDIIYALENDLSVEDFKSVLVESSLAERRPADDMERLQKMLEHADVIVTARVNGEIIGVSRAITDFSYCCYLSDLAVSQKFQKKGIGKDLIDKTHEAAGLNTSLILLSAPAAQSYYPKIGMDEVNNGWIIHKAN